MIKKIYGRENLSLIFSGGRIMSSSAVIEILSRVLYEFKTIMIKRTQILQHKIDEIEIRVIINHGLKDNIPISTIFSIIRDGFYEKIGTDLNVAINIKEVKKIYGDINIISKIDKNKFDEITYI